MAFIVNIIIIIYCNLLLIFEFNEFLKFSKHKNKIKNLRLEKKNVRNVITMKIMASLVTPLRINIYVKIYINNYNRMNLCTKSLSTLYRNNTHYQLIYMYIYILVMSMYTYVCAYVLVEYYIFI